MNQEPSLMKMLSTVFSEDSYLRIEYFKPQVSNQGFIEAI